MEMKLKPSILREYTKEGVGMMPSPPKRGEKLYADESDVLVIEDETGRTELELTPAVTARYNPDDLVSRAIE